MAYLLKTKYEGTCSELVLTTVNYLYCILCELILSVTKQWLNFVMYFSPEKTRI